MLIMEWYISIQYVIIIHLLCTLLLKQVTCNDMTNVEMTLKLNILPCTGASSCYSGLARLSGTLEFYFLKWNVNYSVGAAHLFSIPEYRVGHLVADLNWVDLVFGFSLSARLCCGRWESGSIGIAAVQGCATVKTTVKPTQPGLRPAAVQGVPCPRGLGFVDLDLGRFTLLLRQ